jgi:outer membrane protein assembly factor BamB
VFVGTAVTEKQPKLKSFTEGLRDFSSSSKPPKEEYEWQVVCLDLKTGKRNWVQTVAKGQPGSSTHPSNTFASETLVTDGKRVYGYFGAIGKVFCLEPTGKLVWEQDVGKFPTGNGWGTGSSPALADGRLFVLCDNPKKSFLTAFDAASGKELWSIARKSRTAWCSPYVWRNAKRTELVVLAQLRAALAGAVSGDKFQEARA